ncbi:hypothetical protein M422DRAFT_253056 [Sphaerobolus stellatus SS14]|uniref:Uncharacterized protein n=1 Tax=Sphaerobolus stellatus (strain SS14) TaxID=990650 RepID=A0A0C9V943_SPHS4|nr:hypothetical protein M422DRAFT_253056 [Sphaerobolus stellatus SS14]
MDIVKHAFTSDILWVSHILPYDLILSKNGFQGFSQNNKICSDLIEACLCHNEEFVIANGLLAWALWRNFGDIPLELVSQIDKSGHLSTLLGIIAFNLPMIFPSWSESSLIQPFANIFSKLEQHNLAFPEDKLKDLIVWALDTTQLEAAINTNMSSGHLKSVLQILIKANSLRDHSSTDTGFKHPVTFQEPLLKACNSLIGYAIGIQQDEDSLHNTLLLLSSVDWSSLTTRPSGEFMECLVHTMHSSREELCNAALSVVYALRFQLVSLELSPGLYDRTSHALFTVAELIKVQAADVSSQDPKYPISSRIPLLHANEYTVMQYAQVIHTFMQQITWRTKCIQDRHIKATVIHWRSSVAKLLSTVFSYFEPGKPAAIEEQTEILKDSLSMLNQALSFVQGHIEKHRIGWFRIPGFSSEEKATISSPEVLSLISNVLSAISNIVVFMHNTSSASNAEPHMEQLKGTMHYVHRIRSLGLTRPRLLAIVSRQIEFQTDVEEWKTVEGKLLDLAGKFGWTWARGSQEDSEDNGEKTGQATTDPTMQV